jgi:hypothetical protein
MDKYGGDLENVKVLSKIFWKFLFELLGAFYVGC